MFDQTFGYAINNLGQIAGESRIPTGEHRAFRTAPDSPINPTTDNLGTLGRGDSTAWGINNSGWVVGGSGVLAGNSAHGFLWHNGTMIDLRDLGGNLSFATAINDLGQITGWSAPPFSTLHVFRTAPFAPINPATDDVGTLGGETYGYSINIAGQIAGFGFNTTLGQWRGFRTPPNGPLNPVTSDIGDLGGGGTVAFSVDDLGFVVGFSGTPGSPFTGQHAFRTAPNAPINPATDDLGILADPAMLISQIISSSSTGKYIVGRAADIGGAGRGPFLYTGGKVYALSSLVNPVPNFKFDAAFAVNDSGQIVVSAFGADGQSIHAFRLDPMVDAPVTTATPSPAPNANGWNNTSVTVALHAVDGDGSGVKQIQSLAGGPLLTVSGNSASVVISAEGTSTLSYFATSNSGAVENQKTLIVKIDKTAPVISGLPSAGCQLWPPNGKLVTVATVTASDAISGLVSGSLHVTGTSSDPPDPSDPDVVIAPNGSGGFDIQLRARRSGAGPGRTYTIQATAADSADNVAAVSATCVVPHDQGHER